MYLHGTTNIPYVVWSYPKKLTSPDCNETQWQRRKQEPLVNDLSLFIEKHTVTPIMLQQLHRWPISCNFATLLLPALREVDTTRRLLLFFWLFLLCCENCVWFNGFCCRHFSLQPVFQIHPQIYWNYLRVTFLLITWYGWKNPFWTDSSIGGRKLTFTSVQIYGFLSSSSFFSDFPQTGFALVPIGVSALWSRLIHFSYLTSEYP